MRISAAKSTAKNIVNVSMSRATLVPNRSYKTVVEASFFGYSVQHAPCNIIYYGGCICGAIIY